MCGRVEKGIEQIVQSDLRTSISVVKFIFYLDDGFGSHIKGY
jgi:hypothetical protein